MNRRSFVQSVAGAGLLSQAAAAQPSAATTRLYCLDYFYYRQGDQAGRLQQFLSSQAPLWTKHSRAFGVFTAVMAPHAQTILVLSGFSGFEEMTAAEKRLEADAGFQKAHQELEGGSGPAFDSQQRVLLQATDFSPEIVPLAQKPQRPRYFEIRVYHSPTARQLRLVHERFAGPEIRIFHRSGIHPVLYADTISGPDMQNLTYIIPFASLGDREKAWDTFGADSEWVKVRDESIARGGQIVDYQNLSIWRAAPFSPIQ
jgi:NIPSNAP